MSRLPIPTEPRRVESAPGYLLRVFGLNGVSVKESVSYCRNARRARPLATDADLLAELVGGQAEWFEHRMPIPHARDQWPEVRLFGHVWQEAWLLRGIHQQVCPACLDEEGAARLEWDLLAYPVCHIHQETLQDACAACARALSPMRPALDVCDCGAYLAGAAKVSRGVEGPVLQWCEWLSKQVLPDEHAPCVTGLEDIAPQLRGTSPDGAFRLIFVFGGGMKAYRGAKIQDKRPWLSSERVERLLTHGLDALRASADGRPSGLDGSASRALALQAMVGVTVWDRAAAAREMRNLKLGRRWRDSVPRHPAQQQLFDGLI
ncbi:TniQ family protein [Roseateles cellulosilyticus]|uniref:TniQ family protein n=1 Tax=Pelomonas cellulosilytica TaxID=2906762 RepID=UPI0021075D3A|nr:TniQ family protein [Pelomonas sp. P8]